MPKGIAWISADISRALIKEADRCYPLETGGVLIGYRVEPDTVVVTASFGPGPASVHDRYSYRHDHEWEALEIASHYELSARSEIYIGDWHTHPDASSGDLSVTDRSSLRRVIKSREARLSRPVMSVLFGCPGNWQTSIWVASFLPGWRCLPSLSIHPIELRDFDRTYVAGKEM
jgi:integrative and conjugative element protein (TIGR02256 family)